mgnify:CR=1 FL=1
MTSRLTLILLTALTLAACGSRPENPVDYVTYRDEPLVKQVENGMTMQRVIAIGGSPSTVIDLPHGGTCNNYVLNREGHQQPYYVRFDATGHVDAASKVGLDRFNQIGVARAENPQGARLRPDVADLEGRGILTKGARADQGGGKGRPRDQAERAAA